MKTTVTKILLLGCALSLAGAASAGIVSPRRGGPLPRQYQELKKSRRDAFGLEHAWLERRANQVAGDARYRAARAGTALLDADNALGGELAIPVVLGLYSGMTSPFTRNAFDREFFTGPWATGTLRQYWSEVSYGLFGVTGIVYDWVPLAQNEAYYTGGSSQGYLPPPYGTARTGDMIKEILDALDPSADFGAFDNDGPDGVPNSGDDDGFVDVLLVIHPTWGAECDGVSPHIWSHSWTYRNWPVSGGAPYATNDPAAGGGSIKVDDYIVVPSLSCETGIIEIGVICHELGHAIGLPDLYDWDGGSSGIGFWGLMGAGNWNTPVSPAHLCAWSRERLGWIDFTEIDWRARTIDLRPIETSGDALKLPLPTRRFKRTLSGANNHALICSYSDAEAIARGWPGAGGYGNGWKESMLREFAVDASRPVTMAFDVWIDAESDYDFGRLLLERESSVDTLMALTGRLNGRQPIDIGARLPAGPCSFTLRFEFTSDESYSDEDGSYLSNARNVFSIDNMAISGGGLDYSADFDLDAGGWRNGSPPAEYFVVENRRRSGFDAGLKGEGMLVWHAENSIVYSSLGNSGGTTGTQARGLVLEEADGEYNLLEPTYAGGNTGDGGDPYPGGSNNRSFGPATNPDSYTNGGIESPVTITGVTAGVSSVSATFVGGMPAPTIEEVLPDTIDKEHDAVAALDVRGSWMEFGASAFLALGFDTVRATAVDWRGEERIIATFPIDLLYAGTWDLVVESGSGQPSSTERTIEVVSVYLSASVTAGDDHLLAAWTLKDIAGIRGCLLYRFADGGTVAELVTPDTLRGAAGNFSFKDSSVEPGRSYAYLIVTYLNGGREEGYLLPGPFGIEWFKNYPNPFPRETTVSFFMPQTGSVTIDVYDVSGRVVARLANGRFERGLRTVRWAPAGEGTAAGIYFCVLRAGSAAKKIKLIYVP